MRKRILVTSRSFGKIARAPAEWLETQGFELNTTDRPRPLSEDDMIALIRDMDAVIVGNDKVTAPVLAAGNRLKVVSMHGVGVNHIDVAAAERHGVVVTNVPGANSEAVAELAIGLLFACARRIVESHVSTRAGGWERFAGVEIQGKTLGVVGFGRIGQAVARRAKALGCRVLACDPVADTEAAKQMDVTLTDLDTLLSDADFVSLHLPLTPETEKTINSESLMKMKPGGILINTSRGGVVDEAALAETLRSGHLAAAGVDVYAKEPPISSPLMGVENCIMLSHIGAYSIEALERMGMTAARNAAAVLRGETPEHVVRSSAP